jgi:hypothetical protein
MGVLVRVTALQGDFDDSSVAGAFCGRPHFTHAGAKSEISDSQSGHFTIATIDTPQTGTHLKPQPLPDYKLLYNFRNSGEPRPAKS